MIARRRRRGFTLIELAIVVVIIGVIVGIAVPSFASTIYRADVARVMSDVRTVRQAVLSHVQDEGALPSSSPRWGEAPSIPKYLEPGFPFAYKDFEYRIFVQRRRGRVLMNVRFPRGSRHLEYLQPFADDPGISLTATRMSVHILP